MSFWGKSARTFVALTVFVFTAALLSCSVATAVEPHAGMLRYPDISDEHIVFRYANDIWVAPRGGGDARPLSSPSGGESVPKFSPDGKTIAFMGNYDGDTDIYTIPVSGGVPHRVTHHPATEFVSDWTNDGRLIFAAWGYGGHPHAAELYTVSAEGGLPEKLPVPWGFVGRISPDGEWLAYTPYQAAEFATWKRYMGGRQSDIWLFNLKNNTSKKITDWGGNDAYPMWHGDSIYYVSNAGSKHRMNVWVYDVDTGERRQVTKHSDNDVKWPSMGPGPSGEGEIIYQLGGELRVLNLESEQSRTVRITIPGDRPRVRPRTFDAAGFINGGDISSTGKRLCVEARGDVWSLPAENGTPQNLTRTSGVAERQPVWSPDGRWIAYFSDESGEYELYVMQSDGKEQPEKLTDLEVGFPAEPVWSPDSEKIAFWDQTGQLYITDVDSGRTRKAHKTMEGSGQSAIWASDSNWLTFTDRTEPWTPSSIWLYSYDEDEAYQVTDGVYADTWPTFDREGKYLYFASQRDFSEEIRSDYGWSWVYANTDRLYAVALQDSTESPFLPKIDVEEWEEDGEDGDGEDGDNEAEDDGEDEDADDDGEDEEDIIQIDLDDFESRAIQLPIEPGGFWQLQVNGSGQLLYLRRGQHGPPSLHIFDLSEGEEAEESMVLSGVQYYRISGDGNKLVAANGAGTLAIVDAASDQSWDEPVSTAGMDVVIDPKAEWAQILHDAWRIQRDYFYDPDMHGVDWNGVYRHYSRMVDDCASRADLSYLIGEMIAELNVGHAYYFGGDTEPTASVSVGMLGCSFELENGAYRIGDIYEGGPWEPEARSPLTESGIDIESGDYLLAVNGIELDMDEDPWAAFVGLAGRVVTLTVSDKPKLDEDARDVAIRLIGEGQQSELVYRDWIERNRRYIEERSDGRIGYIYVPDTGYEGRKELFRQFTSQYTRDALIVDERWNGGGNDPRPFVDLLHKPMSSFWATREVDKLTPDPAYANYGPKCLLINESAGSGGDNFPYLFRELGAGPLIGTRTWGGLVGLSGNPGLIDGGYTSVPRFAFVNKDGTWGIEGHGVDPDIEVVADPALMVDGADPQIDKAISVMLSALDKKPVRYPPKPRYPDRSGMGIREEDK